MIFSKTHWKNSRNVESIPNVYKYVRGQSFTINNGNRCYYFQGRIPANGAQMSWAGLKRKTAREAALDVDKRLITLNKEPLNILKRIK